MIINDIIKSLRHEAALPRSVGQNMAICSPDLLDEAADAIEGLANTVAARPKKSINDLAKDIHANAIAHGWWDEARSFGDIISLCHSELSEALEEYRAGRKMVWYACQEGEIEHPCDPQDEYDCPNYGDEAHCRFRGTKPEGIAVEMIDCLIRILDWCGKEGIDVDELLAKKHEYNKGRPYRHGGKVL